MTTVDVDFFSLDQQLKLWERNWSEGLAKEAVWLSGVVERFEDAELEFREDGYLIGSGRVESGARQFKTRFTGPVCVGVGTGLNV